MAVQVVSMLCLVAIASAPAFAGGQEYGFTIDCQYPVEEVPIGTDLYEYVLPIASTGSENDSVDVALTKLMPPTWFSQFCQVSTGICYLTDARIPLPSGVTDTIRVDFVPDLIVPGHGATQLSITSASDPEISEFCAFTLYCGESIPDIGVSGGDCPSETARWTEGPFAIEEFFVPISRTGEDEDSLVVSQDFSGLPGDWFAQICVVSTGVCYLTPDFTIHFGPGAVDTLRIDVITGMDPNFGSQSFRWYSQAIPSYTNACTFTVYDRDAPAGAPDPVPELASSLRIAPNPVASDTQLRFVLESGGRVRADVFSPDGRLVRRIGDGYLPAGFNTLGWDGLDASGRQAPTGVYLIRLETPGSVERAKVVLTR